MVIGPKVKVKSAGGAHSPLGHDMQRHYPVNGRRPVGRTSSSLVWQSSFVSGFFP